MAVDFGVAEQPRLDLSGTALCRCDHVAAEHRLDAGGNLVDCTAVGCPCVVFRPVRVEGDFEDVESPDGHD